MQERVRGPGQIIIEPAAYDYAAYDEIKEQRQRMLGSQRGKDGGYITPMSKDRPLPAVGGDGNGYMSPTAAKKESSKSKDSPSPPGNGGYLSPLEEQLAKHSSSNSDSSSKKSDKSDNTRSVRIHKRCWCHAGTSVYRPLKKCSFSK